MQFPLGGQAFRWTELSFCLQPARRVLSLPFRRLLHLQRPLRTGHVANLRQQQRMPLLGFRLLGLGQDPRVALLRLPLRSGHLAPPTVARPAKRFSHHSFHRDGQLNMVESSARAKFDVVVVGSGFGGAMVAYRLINAGARVLMIERGDWVDRGPASWRHEATLEMTPSYAMDIPYRCERGGHGTRIGSYACVGGPSVYYGCVAIRFREKDFTGDPEIVSTSAAAWPFDYDCIEPFYGEAEELFGVSGDDSGDLTAPRRSRPFPHSPGRLAPISRQLADASGSMGLSPFRLPLAINYTATTTQAGCIACRTCDTYACAISAKNDVATRIIAPLLQRGLTLWTRSVAVRLVADRDRVRHALVVHRDKPERVAVEADRFVLAAGALGSPHLVLASELDKLSPARAAVGRYLMRHANAMVYGVFPRRPDPERRFHKQLALHDWYFGDPNAARPLAKLGSVQQIMTPPRPLVRAYLPVGTKRVLGAMTEQLTGLLCIAEDQPRRENGVRVDWATRDIYGLPQLVIDTSYSPRDELALGTLTRRARAVLEKTGATFSYTHRVRTFSHAVGTLRMGIDPKTSPLDEHCKFRGLANLWVTDSSSLPMSAGVNPSLTITANALRAAQSIV
ncbi:GMC family oxidoreductase [Nocardia sp. NPDC004654]|uniref:GMC family oxidoreductase n=1 Tax=Nocardia sp. NPDC004654 TaxID=3154776 RepID=UPI0033B9B667